MVYVDDTNVSFLASSLVVPVVAPAVEGFDTAPVIPGTGASAVLSTYEQWCEEEDLLLPGGSTRVLYAAIFDAEDSLSAKLKLYCPRSSWIRRVTDDLVATFDAFAES